MKKRDLHSNTFSVNIYFLAIEQSFFFYLYLYFRCNSLIKRFIIEIIILNEALRCNKDEINTTKKPIFGMLFRKL